MIISDLFSFSIAPRHSNLLPVSGNSLFTPTVIINDFSKKNLASVFGTRDFIAWVRGKCYQSKKCHQEKRNGHGCSPHPVGMSCIRNYCSRGLFLTLFLLHRSTTTASGSQTSTAATTLFGSSFQGGFTLTAINGIQACFNKS